MSERGTFCSDYLCPRCAEHLRKTLPWTFYQSKLYSDRDGSVLPAVAGKIIGGFHREWHTGWETALPAMSAGLCRPAKVAVMPDGEDPAFITIHPSGVVDHDS